MTTVQKCILDGDLKYNYNPIKGFVIFRLLFCLTYIKGGN